MSVTGQASLEPSVSAVATAERRRGQACLVVPQPPDDDEKYSYVQRNLPYLTLVLVIGASCLTVSQVRFETHDLVLAPFMLFTTRLRLVPGDQLAGELRRPRV